MSLLYIVRLTKQTSFKNSFFHYFQEITENDCIFSGDFSIDINKMSENKSWINCYETEGYKQLIENFTRVSDNSSSIIDHIYVNKFENIMFFFNVLFLINSRFLSNESLALDQKRKN